MALTNRQNCNFPRYYKARSQGEEFSGGLRLIVIVHIISLDTGALFFCGKVSIYIRLTNCLLEST